MVSRYRLISCAAALAAFCVVTSGCDRTTKSAKSIPDKGAETMSQISIQSTAFKQNAAVPRKHTGDAADVSPPLSWSNLPQGTKELALIVDDPDAPRPQPWVHWVIYKIPADAGGLPDAVSASERLSAPAGALQGKNDFGTIGYRGPAPPRGHGVHRYFFKLYALDAQLSLGPGATKPELLKAMQGHILAQGELVGTYQR